MARLDLTDPRGYVTIGALAMLLIVLIQPILDYFDITLTWLKPNWIGLVIAIILAFYLVAKVAGRDFNSKTDLLPLIIGVIIVAFFFAFFTGLLPEPLKPAMLELKSIIGIP